MVMVNHDDSRSRPQVFQQVESRERGRVPEDLRGPTASFDAL